MDGSRSSTAQSVGVLTDRAIPPRLAPIVAELELDQPKVVSLDEIAAAAQIHGIPVTARSLAFRLARRGWLIPLRTKSMYEFVPAARAGLISSGDPFIEVRATLKRRPSLPLTIAEESAAWLHGLSGRTPQTHVVSTPPGIAIPRSLGAFRTVHFSPHLDPLRIDGLPVWRRETLLVMMAARPASFGDWNNALDWLGEAIDASDPEMIDRELTDQPTAVGIRLAYLFERADRSDHLTLYLRNVSRSHGPVYLGPERQHGRYDSRFNIVDSLLPIGLNRADAAH
jgi:predicted transcriptional regulator of viral defense system